MYNTRITQTSRVCHNNAISPVIAANNESTSGLTAPPMNVNTMSGCADADAQVGGKGYGGGGGAAALHYRYAEYLSSHLRDWLEQAALGIRNWPT